MREVDRGLVEWCVSLCVCVVFPLSFLKDTAVLFHPCHPGLENSMTLPIPPAPGENAVRQLYCRVAAVANEQQDYHSDPRCY